MEDVTVADYTHAKRVCKDFEIKDLGEYHDLYVQSDTLLLADVKLPKKEDFYRHVKMEDVTDTDYKYVKRVCKDFEIKDLGEYHDLYVQSNRLLLADVFTNFHNNCFEMHELDLARILCAPGLA